jgi:hypothetical protein
VVVACGAGELGVTVTVGVAAAGMTTVLVPQAAIPSPAAAAIMPRMNLFFMMPPGLMVSYLP